MSQTQIPFLVLPLRLQAGEQKDIGIYGDFMSYVSVVDANNNPIDPSNILIDLGSGFVAMSSILPAKMTFYKFSIKNNYNTTVTVTLIIGFETSVIYVQNINIARDLVGLFKTADWNKSLDANNNIKINVITDSVGLAKDSTVALLAKDSTFKFFVSVLNNAVITANGKSSTYDVWSYKQLDVTIYVSAVSGTSPTITFYVDVLDSLGNVIKSYAGSTLSAVGSDYITITGTTIGRYVRVRWVVGGTSPSFTVNVELVGKV
jgi:hypothetical protein